MFSINLRAVKGVEFGNIWDQLGGEVGCGSPNLEKETAWFGTTLERDKFL